MAVNEAQLEGLGNYQYGWSDSDEAGRDAMRGLSEEVVRNISALKSEPQWMLDMRLKGLSLFSKKPMPTWGADLSGIDFDNIKYFVRSTEAVANTWEDLPAEIKNTYDRLGIPEAEKQRLVSGVAAQYESEVVYHSIREDLAKLGVIFLDTDTALKEYPELFKEYFASVIPVGDNKFSALNTAVWSGGCLTASTRVFTYDSGLKSIAEIKEGDRIFALNDEGQFVPSKVLAQVHNGQKPVYRIRVAGRTIEATENHKFLALRHSEVNINGTTQRWYSEWVPLGELEVGDIIAISKQLPEFGNSKTLPALSTYTKGRRHLEHQKVPTQTSPDLLWLLGIWVGDGNTHWIGKHMCQVNFALPISTKPEIRNEAKKLLKGLFGLDPKNNENEVSFTVSSKAFGKWLEELGLTGKAKTKRIPAWVYGLPVQERLSFLGGLLDSDGNVSPDGQLIAYELCNKDLVEDIKMLAISCGLYSDGKVVSRQRKPTTLKDGRKIHGGPSYRCRLSGNIARIDSRATVHRTSLDEHDKQTFDKYSVSTKKNFSSMATNHLGFAPIREKDYIGVENVYDIQVEEYSNFIANGIVTHNSFIYVPKGVHVDIPLQAYFRINTESMGQFERTLILADEDSYVHYVEGCTAPVYSSASLHSAVVEIVVKRGAKVRYTTIQNWSNNVYNLVTKRATCQEGATMEWIDANLGSCVTMKYPAVFLLGEHSVGETLSIAMAGEGQCLDAGAKMVHAAPFTSSTIISKSIARSGGRTSYRGLVQVQAGAHHSKSTVKCDALLIDNISRSDTFPYVDIREDDVSIGHEATVSKISDEQIFYLMSRGLSEDEAIAMIVRGFIEPVARTLPMEYSLELNRLIELQMEGAVG